MKDIAWEGHPDPRGPRGPRGASNEAELVRDLIKELRGAKDLYNLLQSDEDGNVYVPIDSYAAEQAADMLEHYLSVLQKECPQF